MRIVQQRPACANWADIPAPLRARLEAESVRTPADWTALGAGRKRIFGIVPSIVRQLDALAREPTP